MTRLTQCHFLYYIKKVFVQDDERMIHFFAKNPHNRFIENNEMWHNMFFVISSHCVKLYHICFITIHVRLSY